MVAMSSLPSKLFFRIGEVAGLVGVEPHVLRYWEREFRSIRPTKSAKGQRVYSRRDVENLLRVRDLLYRDGFTIAGAKKRLQRGAGESADPAQAMTEALGDQVLEAHASETLEDDEDEAIPAEPASGPRSHPDVAASDVTPALATSGASSARAKLSALRAEVEGFLEELESPVSDRTERA
jgi:DNA-binding transcriptional MerR regulator